MAVIRLHTSVTSASVDPACSTMIMTEVLSSTVPCRDPRPSVIFVPFAPSENTKAAGCIGPLPRRRASAPGCSVCPWPLSSLDQRLRADLHEVEKVEVARAPVEVAHRSAGTLRAGPALVNRFVVTAGSPEVPEDPVTVVVDRDRD